MTTLSPAPVRRDAGSLLRFALRLDGMASGALGAIALVGAPLLATPLGSPAGLTGGLGAFLLGYAAALFGLAARRTIPRPAGWTVVAGNLAWVLGSGLAAATGTLTELGVAVVATQAAAVAGFAALQAAGIRRLPN